MAKRWYVVHAYSGFEHQVQRALATRIARAGMEDRFGQVLVPTEEVVEMRAGQKRKSERKFFPGYVLVQIETDEEGGVPRIDDESWHLIKETPKVMGFIGGVLAGAGAAWFTAPGKTFTAFARESIVEVKKVVWPTRKETVQTTAAVFAFVVVMAVFLWISDKTLEWVLYEVVLGWKKA